MNKEVIKEEALRTILKEVWELMPDDITNNDLAYSTQIEPHIKTSIDKAFEEGKKEEREGIIKELTKIEDGHWTDAEHCSCLGYAISNLTK